MRFVMTSLLAAGAMAGAAHAQDLSSFKSLPTGHAPIGVMGDHMHKEGEWMTSYRYSSMMMDGNRDGTDRLSESEVLSNYMVAPQEMRMEMHMFGLMYGVSDDFTAMVMAPYVRKQMDHVTRMGMQFSTETKGLGDVKLGGMYRLNDVDDRDVFHLNFNVSLPTGSIDERGATPMNANAKLPYPMQLGSGTFDPMLGLTYVHNMDGWSLGGQADATFRLYDNSEDYHLGNSYHATTWLARNLNEYLSVSARLDGTHWEDIDGADPELNPMMIATADPALRGGTRVDALVGVNLLAQDGGLKDHRLAFEFGVPVYQDLDGPQLETDYRLTLGWQYAF
ncbi:MAG: hypothetical protein CMM94_00690 [Rickettsiales bacterium]|mgnify:CR=1 FL=1|nr:hypothetical protein [Rickettsiales bacterium]